MSDTNEPPRPDGSADEPAPPPPSTGAPPPPPPPATGEGPYGAPGGDSPYGGAGADPYGGAGAYGGAPGSDPYGGAGGGDGTPPPTAQGGYYGAPQEPAYSPTDAIGFGWRAFTAKPATLLVPVLVIGMIIVVVSALIRLLVVGGLTDANSSLGPVLFAAALSSAITTVIVSVLSAGLYKGGFAVADGHPLSMGQLFEGWDKVQVIIAALIIGLLTLIGTVLCYFPALLVGYFLQFTIPYIVDKNMSALDAIAASFRLCTQNLGATILWYLLAVVCIVVGAVICLVGLLVAVPVVLVGLAYTFRRLQGEQVAQAAPRPA